MISLNDWLNRREISKCFTDELIYGTSFKLIIQRSKWNPMTYILNDRHKIKRVDPRRVIICRNGQKSENLSNSK